MATWYMEVYMKCKGPHSIYSENWKSKQFVFIAKSNSEFLFLLPVQPRSTETEGNGSAVGCLVFRKPLDSCCVLPPEVTRERRPAKEKCAVVSPPTHTHTHSVSAQLLTAVVSSCQAWFDKQVRARLLFSDICFFRWKSSQGDVSKV